MVCGYTGCKYNGQRRSFKRHNAVKHGGQAIVFQNSAFGHGGRWHSWLVRNTNGDDVGEQATEQNDCTVTDTARAEEGSSAENQDEFKLPTQLHSVLTCILN